MRNKNATANQITYALFRNGCFDNELYRLLFPDINEAISKKRIPSEQDHWEKFGLDEVIKGLRAVDLELLYKSAGDLLPISSNAIDDEVTRHFDSAAYLATYPDIINFNGSPLEHWLHHGRFEFRKAFGIAPFTNRAIDLEKVSTKPFGVNVFGMNSCPTGLGRSSRGYCEAFTAAGISQNYHEISIDAYKKPLQDLGFVRKFLDSKIFNITLLIQNADMLQKFQLTHDISAYDSTYKIGLWAWELPQFRDDWWTSFAALDEIWVPSEFCKKAIQPLINMPVTVLPHVVSVGKLETKYSRLYFGLPKKKFIFTYIFDVSSTIARKNPYVLIRAFRNAFKDNDKVALVLKFHASSGMQSEIRALYMAAGDDDRIILIEKTFTDAENTAFKYCADCFVSPHRSEGFGLNIAEMLLLGKPVIATGYSGPNDFFNSDVGYPIKYQMIELDHWIGPYPPGSTWANPDCDDLARLMHHVVDHPEEAKAKAKKGQQEIERRFSADAIGLLAMKRFAELELDRDLPCWMKYFGKTKDLYLNNVSSPARNSLTYELISRLSSYPKFSIIVPVFNISPELLEECINSVRMQSYPNWELCLVDDCSTKTETTMYLKSLVGKDPRYRIDFLDSNLGISGCMNRAASIASGEFIAFLDDDDVIHQDALLRIAQEISHCGNNVDFIYTDEVKLDQEGQVCDSYFKPDFSPEHLESVMYLLHFLVVRKRLFLAIGGFREAYSGAQDYDLALRLSRATNRIIHIDEPLYCWRKINGSASASLDAKPAALIAAKRALEDHAKEKYGEESVVETTSLTGIFHLRKLSKTRPKVTLVICTDNRSKDIDGRGYINMVANMHNSIIQKTTYPNYEILIAANGICSVNANAKKEKTITRIIHYKNHRNKKSGFNFSHKINWVLGHVETEYFVILNDDMEVIEPKWLDYLMDQIQDPEVGAVGAKLLTGLGTIQHVGVIVSTDGTAKHIYHGFPGDFIGYNGYTHVIRNFSAVTGACLATKRTIFDAIGGFDELFAIDYNDTDFCLKIQDKGYRVVLNPNAILFHFESATLPRVIQNKAETELFHSRWIDVINRDPYYNKNLSQMKHDLSDRDIVSNIYSRRLFLEGEVRWVG